MTLYDITLTTLTPLHIGDGDELRLRFDIVAAGGRTYRLDEDTILREKADQLNPQQDGSYPLPGELLTKPDLQNSAYFRYIIPGFPRSEKTYAEVKSFIKDVHDRPYIPGSSLKGALRTALAWNGWDEQNITIHSINEMKYKKGDEWIPSRNPANRYERVLFEPSNKHRCPDRRNPNLDLMRTLHVSDCFGPEKPGEGLALVNAQVLTQKNQGSPIEMEALRGDVPFTGTLKIDDTLFEMPEARKLGFANRKHWLDELAARTQNHSRSRIQNLIDWYERSEQYPRMTSFYKQLYDAALQPNQALLQLGWGSGWDGKTFGTHLQKDIYLFEKIVKDFRLHRRQKGSPPRKPGDPFPRSKRAAMTVKDGKALALAPFGWVLFEMEEKLSANPR